MNHMFSCTKPRRLGEIQTSSLKQEDTFPLSPSGWLARHASTQSKWCTVHIEYAPNTYKLVYKLLRCTGSTINPSVNLVTSKVSRVWGCMGPQNPFFSGLIPIFFMLKPAILLRSSCLRLQWRSFCLLYHMHSYMLSYVAPYVGGWFPVNPKYFAAKNTRVLQQLRPYLQLPLGSSVSSRWSPIRPRKHRKPAKL